VFEWIRAEKAISKWSVERMCDLLGVSTSGYYAHFSRGTSQRELENRALLELIREIHKESDGTYGGLRVHAELRHQGILVSVNRVRRLMRDDGLSGLVKRRRSRAPQVSAQGVHAADLVLREWHPSSVGAVNVLWVADITYVKTWQGWLYLAVVMDAFSRRIVGWSMQPHLRTELVQDALDMAVDRRQPKPGLVHHSDHGTQYTALTFGHELKKYGIDPSMGRVRTCYDNAVAESFFATLKKERLNRYSWPTRHDAQLTLFDYIERWYNVRRRHSTLGYLTPAEFEDTAS
jgi:putative transposase